MTTDRGPWSQRDADFSCFFAMSMIFAMSMMVPAWENGPSTPCCWRWHRHATLFDWNGNHPCQFSIDKPAELPCCPRLSQIQLVGTRHVPRTNEHNADADADSILRQILQVRSSGPFSVDFFLDPIREWSSWHLALRSTAFSLLCWRQHVSFLVAVCSSTEYLDLAIWPPAFLFKSLSILHSHKWANLSKRSTLLIFKAQDVLPLSPSLNSPFLLFSVWETLYGFRTWLI